MTKPEFVCPRCRGKLEIYQTRYDCRTCVESYPIVDGIPDFRLYPDPYISMEDDRAKGCYLADQTRHLSFQDLVAHYYSITPEVPLDLASRYRAHHLAGMTRGQSVLQRLAAYGLATVDEIDGPALDLGCGTAGLLAAVLAQGVGAIGIDIAFRWLVIGRRRLQELEYEDFTLVCACADYLPFPPGVFEVVVAENLIEHTQDVPKVLVEAARVRKPGGAFMARTINRFALAPEPHVGVWGVGFLPQKWMDGYVRRVKGIPYQHIRLHSYWHLRQLLNANGLSGLQVHPPLILPEDYAHHTGLKRKLFAGYSRLVQWPSPLRQPLTFFGPYVDIISQPQS